MPRVGVLRGSFGGLLVALIAVSCAPRTPAFEPTHLVRELRRPLADWCVYWRQYDPAFTLDSLRWSLVDSIQVERTEALLDSLRNSADSRWWAWSPDRTRAVNPDTYREWDPDRKEFGYDADAQAELLDFTTRRGSLLEFCGTGCRYDDAVWLDRERFALMGWVAIGDSLSRYAPRVTVYDIDRRSTATGVGRGVRMEMP